MGRLHTVHRAGRDGAALNTAVVAFAGSGAVATTPEVRLFRHAIA